MTQGLGGRCFLAAADVHDQVGPFNGWLVDLFGPGNVDRTVRWMMESQAEPRRALGVREAVKARLGDAEARLRRFQDAIGAGAEPAAFVDAINEAHAQRMAARAELEGLPVPSLVTDGEMYAMIDSLGDAKETLKGEQAGQARKVVPGASSGGSLRLPRARRFRGDLASCS